MKYALDFAELTPEKITRFKEIGYELVHVLAKATGLPVSTFSNPAFVWNGWHFFMEYDQFIPSTENDRYICHCFAWKARKDKYYPQALDRPANQEKHRYYCAIPGIDGAFEYGPGMPLPVNVHQCRITAQTDQDTINREYMKAMESLVALVREKEMADASAAIH